MLPHPRLTIRVGFNPSVVRALIAVGATCAGFTAGGETPPAAPLRSMFGRLSPEAQAHHEATAIRLWPAAAPGALGNASADIPLLFPVLPLKPAAHARPAILVFASGSCTFHSAAEAFPIAERFRAAGFAAFALKNRLNPYSRSAA